MTRVLSCAAAILIIPVLVLAQSPGTPVPAELAAVRREIAAMEAKLKGVEQRQADLSRERDKLETEVALAELRVQESETETVELARQEAAAARDAAESQRLLEDATERLKMQITLLSVLGRGGFAPLVLHVLGAEKDLSVRMTTALVLVREQKRQRDETAALAERRAATLSLLLQRRDEHRNALETLAQRRVALDRSRVRLVAELARLERERRAGAVALADAQESEARLERLWGVVQRDSDEVGGNVQLLRGGMPWPVKAASIVQRFGPHRDAHYGTTTVTHGVVLAVKAGAEVCTVATGKVVYAQFFRGYDNLVIVHHGNQVYSLYGQLATMLRRAGERVAMGDPVGLAAPGDNGDGRVYLEIRVGQTAQDPMAWLKPAEK